METRFETANRSEFERHKIEEKRTIGFGRKRYKLTFRLRSGRIVNMLKIRSFAAKSRTVINDLTIDLTRCVVNESHIFGVNLIYQMLAEKAVYVFVSDLGKYGLVTCTDQHRFADGFIEHCGDLVARAFCTDLNQTER